MFWYIDRSAQQTTVAECASAKLCCWLRIWPQITVIPKNWAASHNSADVGTICWWLLRWQQTSWTGCNTAIFQVRYHGLLRCQCTTYNSLYHCPDEIRWPSPAHCRQTLVVILDSAINQGRKIQDPASQVWALVWTSAITNEGWC